MRLLACIALVCMALALSGCGTGESGDAKVVQNEQQTMESGSPVILLRLEVTTYDRLVWERVALARDRKLVGLTALARGARIACDSPRSCRAQVLAPGAIWPKTYEIEPRRFFLSDTEHADLNEIGPGLTVPIPVDSAQDGRAGFKPAAHDLLGEAAVIAKLVERQVTREWSLAAAALIATLFCFVCCWCVGYLLRRFWPQSAPVAWLRRWPCARTIPLLAYACAIAVFIIPFFTAFADGPGAVAQTRIEFLGVQVIYLEGRSPLEPLLSLILVVSGVAVFDLLARALRAVLAARAETAAQVDAHADL
jgi:hypothetical protein